jgi:MFS family permease
MTGVRGGLVLSMSLYVVYTLGFCAAAFTTSTTLQGLLFGFGSVCGGLAAGLLWTSQGSFMVESAAAVSVKEERDQALVTAELATQFAFYYLLFEEIAKIMWSCLMVVGVSVQFIGLLFSVLAILSAYGLHMLADITPKAQEEKSPFSKIHAAVSLWGDVRIWLLSFTNITFGIAAAYMNGYFNREVATEELGTQYLGYLTAFTVIISVVATQVYGYISQQHGHFAPLMIGACSFALIPLVYFVTSCCKGWSWQVLLFYALQGSGRSVYESTNKAIFADTFKDNAEGAFANQVIQMSLASGMCFFASAALDGQALRILILIAATLTPIGYMIKLQLDDKESAEAEPLLDKSA